MSKHKFLNSTFVTHIMGKQTFEEVLFIQMFTVRLFESQRKQAYLQTCGDGYIRNNTAVKGAMAPADC